MAEEQNNANRIRHIEGEVALVKAGLDSVSRGMTELQTAFNDAIKELRGDLKSAHPSTNWGWIIAGVMAVLGIGSMYTTLVTSPLRENTEYVTHRIDAHTATLQRYGSLLGELAPAVSRLQAARDEQLRLTMELVTHTTTNATENEWSEKVLTSLSDRVSKQEDGVALAFRENAHSRGRIEALERIVYDGAPTPRQ